MNLWFLPPYNLARLFSYTRNLEKPCPICAERAEQIKDLRERIEKLENYNLSLLGQRPLNVEKKEVRAAVLTGRQSLASIRRSAVSKAIANSMQHIEDNGMQERADLYAESLKTD